MKEINNIYEIFEDSLVLHSNEIAIIDHDDTPYTYFQLNKLIDSKSKDLITKGLKKGDRVALLIPMSIELYVHILSLFKIGIIPVFIDSSLSINSLRKSIKDLNCIGLIASRKIIFASYILIIRFKIRIISRLSYDNNKAIIQNTNANDTALITLTTGSTGTPKAANRTHKFLHAQLNELKEILLSYDSKVDMPLLPIVLLLNLAIGRTSVIAKLNFQKPKDFDSSKIITQIEQYKIESLTGSPYFVHRLSSSITASSSLKNINVGGGTLLFDYGKEIINNCSQININIVYGSTEAEPISYFRCNEYYAKSSTDNGLCIGKPSLNTKVEILLNHCESTEYLNKNNSYVSTIPNNIGEIIVSGEHVLKSYINSSSENKIRFNNKTWHRTGDLGYLDKSGNLFYCGRTYQIIQFPNNIEINLFLLELSIIKEFNTKDCAIIYQEYKLHIFLPINTKFNILEIRNHLQLPSNLPIKIYNIHIPKDKRHLTKYDYQALKKFT